MTTRVTIQRSISHGRSTTNAGQKQSEPEAQAASAVLEDLESLRSRVTVAEQQRDEYLALLQRTRADFENYQKRIQRDLAEERRQTLAGFVRELLAVLDNLQRAVDAARQQGEKARWSREWPWSSRNCSRSSVAPA